MERTERSSATSPIARSALRDVVRSVRDLDSLREEDRVDPVDSERGVRSRQFVRDGRLRYMLTMRDVKAEPSGYTLRAVSGWHALLPVGARRWMCRGASDETESARGRPPPSWRVVIGARGFDGDPADRASSCRNCSVALAYACGKLLSRPNPTKSGVSLTTPGRDGVPPMRPPWKTTFATGGPNEWHDGVGAGPAARVRPYWRPTG